MAFNLAAVFIATLLYVSDRVCVVLCCVVLCCVVSTHVTRSGRDFYINTDVAARNVLVGGRNIRIGKKSNFIALYNELLLQSFDSYESFDHSYPS